MSLQFFEVREHVFDGQHIREYPRATAQSQEDVLQVVAKQYIPRSNPDPQPGDITIVAAHANGFVKELYEPLWDDLLAACARRGVRLRGIWIADVAWQGASGLRNADLLGNDPSWHDHARDVLQMVNTFRRDMPRPLVGLGHSFGASLMAQASLWHPRLFSSLVLMDPVLNTGTTHGFNPLELSAARREVWSSRAAAAASFQRSPFYRSWDPRVLDRFVQFGLTDLPTKLFPRVPEEERDTEPGKADPPVTLATTKHQECFTFLRPLLQGVDADGKRVFRRDRLHDISDDSLYRAFGIARDTEPDAADAAAAANKSARGGKLYRPEVVNTAAQLPHVRPGVCYVFGGQSPMSTPALRRDKMASTGTGVGGSGGEAAGRVREVVLPKTGHLVAMDEPGACAEAAADWLAHDLRHEREEAAELAAAWWPRSDAQKQTMDDEWAQFIERKPKSRL